MSTTSEPEVPEAEVGTPADGPGILERPAPTAVPPTARRTGRRRRPTGAAPPLPRSIGRSGKGWLIALAVLAVWIVVTLMSRWAKQVTDQIDAAILRTIARARTDWLTTVFRGVDRIATGWSMFYIAIALLIAMVVFRRWRHLFTFLASVIILEIIGLMLIAAYQRPRPYDVTTIGRWRGFSLPSATAAVVTFTVIGIIYTMVVAGRPRSIAKAVGAVVVGIFVFARLYLGVDHPFDDLVGVALSVAILVNAFRFFAPNDFFPVSYHQGKTAHLDVEGRRGEALRQAVEEQLGVTILEVKPVGLAGSGGSTPLRLRVAGDPDTFLFGKLYAMNHVRADRWYKLGRTILYGRLEDEAPFQSVRRLVEYEDYTLRVMRDAGIPTADALGIVELTPDREYMLVTGFFDGAEEIGDAEVDDQIIDEGLTLVRRMWQAGLAHRDIKPANLLVKDGHLVVIDVAFAQIRPSPWRQAIDLANMMLVLAVRTDAERVYRRALEQFSPDEIAEAFAATRGIASPTQLRTMMKQDGRDLVAQFRAMAPERRPISLQRWSARRFLLAAGLVIITTLLLANVYGMFSPAELPVGDPATCGTSQIMILMAQTVPSATDIPCVITEPAGWKASQLSVQRDRARFWLSSDQEGRRAVEVTLLPPEDCDVGNAREVRSEFEGMQRFERSTLTPELRTQRWYISDAQCITYVFEFDRDEYDELVVDIDEALSTQPRAELVAEVERRSDLVLCGAMAPPCVGGSG